MDLSTSWNIIGIMFSYLTLISWVTRNRFWQGRLPTTTGKKDTFHFFVGICTHSCILCFSIISLFRCRFSTNIFQFRRWSISCWSDFHESQIFVENMPHWQLEQAKFFVSHMSWHLLLHTHLLGNQLCRDMITFHSPSKLSRHPCTRVHYFIALSFTTSCTPISLNHIHSFQFIFAFFFHSSSPFE